MKNFRQHRIVSQQDALERLQAETAAGERSDLFPLLTLFPHVQRRFPALLASLPSVKNSCPVVRPFRPRGINIGAPFPWAFAALRPRLRDFGPLVLWDQACATFICGRPRICGEKFALIRAIRAVRFVVEGIFLPLCFCLIRFVSRPSRLRTEALARRVRPWGSIYGQFSWAIKTGPKSKVMSKSEIRSQKSESARPFVTSGIFCG
jgi:hypothetical protein